MNAYDAWKTTNPADEAAAEYEAQRDKLAARRGCAPDDITDADLDEWLAIQHERQIADDLDAREFRDEYRREMEPWRKEYEG